MILHFNCPPISGNPAAQPPVFPWDPEAGTVTGPCADQVREHAQPGARFDAHPLPWSVTMGSDPLRSWRDMAFIVGTSWRVPLEAQAALSAAAKRRLGRQGAGTRGERRRRGNLLVDCNS